MKYEVTCAHDWPEEWVCVLGLADHVETKWKVCRRCGARWGQFENEPRVVLYSLESFDPKPAAEIPLERTT